MSFTAQDIVPLGKVRAGLSALCEQAREGADKIITRNGEAYVALIDARRLDYYQQMERELAQLRMLGEAVTALTEVAAGEARDIDALWAHYGR